MLPCPAFGLIHGSDDLPMCTLTPHNKEYNKMAWALGPREVSNRWWWEVLPFRQPQTGPAMLPCPAFGLIHGSDDLPMCTLTPHDKE